ncbi:MAG: hypothetical protein AAGE52_01370 [Myxococcota bacterium]
MNPADIEYNARPPVYGDHERLDPKGPKTIMGRHVSTWGPWTPQRRKGSIYDPLRGMLEKPWLVQSVAHERLARVIVYVRGVPWKVQLALRKTAASLQLQEWEIRRLYEQVGENERPSQPAIDWLDALPVPPSHDGPR